MYHILNLLRGIASVIVFFAHTPLKYTHVTFFWTDIATSLVELFFILSGVIFQVVYSKNVVNGKESGWDFAVKRFSRLYPLLFITTVIPVIVDAYYGYLLADWKKTFVYHLFLMYGWCFNYTYRINDPQWSLTAEILAYAAFFLIKRYLPKKVTESLWFDALVMTPMFLRSLAPKTLYIRGFRVPTGICFFWCGVFLAKIAPNAASTIDSTIISLYQVFSMIKQQQNDYTADNNSTFNDDPEMAYKSTTTEAPHNNNYDLNGHQQHIDDGTVTNSSSKDMLLSSDGNNNVPIIAVTQQHQQQAKPLTDAERLQQIAIKTRSIIFLSIATIIFFGAIAFEQFVNMKGLNIKVWHNFEATVFMPIIIFSAMMFHDDLLSKPFVKFCDMMSQISFSLYVIHYPILVWLRREFGDDAYFKVSPVFFFPVFLFVFVLAYFTYHYFEMPMQNLLRNLLLPVKQPRKLQSQQPPTLPPDATAVSICSDDITAMHGLGGNLNIHNTKDERGVLDVVRSPYSTCF